MDVNCSRPGCDHRRVYTDGQVFSNCLPHVCACGELAVYWSDGQWRCKLGCDGDPAAPARLDGAEGLTHI